MKYRTCRQVTSAAASGGGSRESDHDLSMMVNDFLENSNNSCETGSRYSSDSDSSLSDLLQLSHKISVFKLATDKYERDLLSVVNSLALSMNERDLRAGTPGLCNASCIRFTLVNLLRLSGFDAGVCRSRWQGISKVPGGDHEYIDVIYYDDSGTGDRLVVDVDFRSHFEIARAVESYGGILSALPVVYVGPLAKLEQYLHVMAEAAQLSLKQNSMPLPPWRSFAYLRAKWASPYQRRLHSDLGSFNGGISGEHHKCGGRLRKLQSLIASNMGGR